MLRIATFAAPVWAPAVGMSSPAASATMAAKVAILSMCHHLREGTCPWRRHRRPARGSEEPPAWLFAYPTRTPATSHVRAEEGHVGVRESSWHHDLPPDEPSGGAGPACRTADGSLLRVHPRARGGGPRPPRVCGPRPIGAQRPAGPVRRDRDRRAQAPPG